MERDEALAAFYKQYEKNPLVVLKWLTLKSASNVPANLDTVDGLQSHPAFDVKNPNCCYSLYLGCVLVPTCYFHKLKPVLAYSLPRPSQSPYSGMWELLALTLHGCRCWSCH